jgi:hypothetical protein
VDNSGPLSGIADLAATLAADGHVTVRGLLDPSVLPQYRQLVTQAAARADKLVLPEPNEIYQRAFDQYMNLWQVDERVGEITLNPDLASVAAALLGVPAVRVYHDQALLKRAGGGATPWHQDQWYWPLDTNRTITMWLPLHAVNAEMGGLHFASGTQAGPIGDEPISAESDRHYEQYLADQAIRIDAIGTLEPGDASFHLGWTLHRADANTTSADRDVMTVIWFADGAKATAPENQGQADDLLRWLQGVKPGELAAGALNPRVG